MKRTYCLGRKKSAGCVSHCHRSIISKIVFQRINGRKTKLVGTYQVIQSSPLIKAPRQPFPFVTTASSVLKAVTNPICGTTVWMPRNHFLISSLNLFLVICILKHPWLLFSSLVFTHLIHFQTANISHFCFCFARLNKSFPSISYRKAGSLSVWSFSLPYSASTSSNSPFFNESDQNYLWYWT